MKGKVGVIAILFISIFFIPLTSAALGLATAAKNEYHFTPYLKIQHPYTVLSDKPDRNIELYLEGDLAEYAKLSKDKVSAGEKFEVIVTLPDKIETPGLHRLLVGAKEVDISEESFIATVIDVRALIKIFVPYPGKYAEVTMDIPDINLGENIPVEVRVVNRGKETLDLDVKVDFFENAKNQVETVSFQPVTLESGGERYFRKLLNSSNFKAGDYMAQAIVDYKLDNVIVNDSFRVGSLLVKIGNFTTKLRSGGIKKFNIDIESRWNSNLEEVYADVNVFNGVDKNVTFRTPSATLSRWERGTLTGFLDTNEMEGNYNTEIVLRYADQVTLASGTLLIRKINYIVIGIVAVLIVLIVLYFIWRRRKKQK